MSKKRAHEEPPTDALAPGSTARTGPATTRSRRNPEVVSAGAWPSRDTLLSPFVREELAYRPPNEAQFWAYWNKIAVPATNVAKAIGMNPYPDGTPGLLWARLRGHEDATPPPMPPEQEERVARGIDLEPVARAQYEIALRTKVTRHDHAFAPNLPWLLHGCDGHARGRQNVRAVVGAEHPYIIEIKCPMNGPYKAIPRDYMVQMQVGMALHGVQWCDFCMFTQRRAPGDAEGTQPLIDRLTVQRVHRSNACIELILTHVAYFVDCLRYNVPPKAAMAIPAAKHVLFEAPNISVTPVFDADVPPLPQPGDDPMTVTTT